MSGIFEAGSEKQNLSSLGDNGEAHHVLVVNASFNLQDLTGFNFECAAWLIQFNIKEGSKDLCDNICVSQNQFGVSAFSGDLVLKNGDDFPVSSRRCQSDFNCFGRQIGNDGNSYCSGFTFGSHVGNNGGLFQGASGSLHNLSVDSDIDKAGRLLHFGDNCVMECGFLHDSESARDAFTIKFRVVNGNAGGHEDLSTVERKRGSHANGLFERRMAKGGLTFKIDHFTMGIVGNVDLEVSFSLRESSIRQHIQGKQIFSWGNLSLSGVFHCTDGVGEFSNQIVDEGAFSRSISQCE